jgi:hypothetical protein
LFFKELEISHWLSYLGAGTNDNRMLLPLQVRQLEPADASLKATNSKMLDVILNNPKFSVISPVRCRTAAG